jgi:hypothetical protein
MRQLRWISLMTGATLFGMGGITCNPDLLAIASQGTANLLTSIVNSLIETFVNGTFNLPNTGGLRF